MSTIPDQEKLAINRLVSDITGKRPIVTIWGAGASIESGLPGGWYLINRMKKDLKPIIETDTARRKLENDYEKALSCVQSDQNHPSLEYMLSIFSRICGTNKLHRWLIHQIPHQNSKEPPVFPTFAHEFCSHLVQAKVLKYFISLNFDELLENCLHEEIGTEKVKVLKSEVEFGVLKDVPKAQWESQFGLPQPQCFVFKPHGTISQGLSLRHLPKHVRKFEKSKQEVLKSVLEDSLVVFLGFGNYNEDFRLLFGKIYPLGLTNDVIIVDLNPNAVVESLGGISAKRQIFEFRGSIENFFKTLAQHLEEDSVYKEVHQKATRHKIRSLYFSLFHRHLASMEDEENYNKIHSHLAKIPKWWFEVRLLEIELLIYLAKTRGLFITLAILKCGRIGNVLKRCVDVLPPTTHGPLVDLSPQGRLGEMLNGSSTPLFGFSPVIDRHGLSGLNTFWCFLLAGNSCEGNLYTRKTLENVFAKVAEQLSIWLVQSLKDSLGNRVDPSLVHWFTERICNSTLEQEISGYLYDLYTDFDVDLSETDYSGIIRFRKARLLKKRNDLIEWTRKLIGTSWDRLKVGTVSGEWLTKEFDLLIESGKVPNNGKIIMISNLDMFSEKGNYQQTNIFHYLQMIRSLSGLITAISKCPNVNLQLLGVPNWEHHMLIASSMQNPDGEEIFNGGTYFRRVGKDTSISPFKLSDQDDLDDLSRYFDERCDNLNKMVGAKFLLRTDWEPGRLRVTVSGDNPYRQQLYRSLGEALSGTDIKIDL